MKLISSAVVIMAGGLMAGLGSLAPRSDNDIVVAGGFFVLACGLFVFATASFREGTGDDAADMVKAAVRLFGIRRPVGDARSADSSPADASLADPDISVEDPPAKQP